MFGRKRKKKIDLGRNSKIRGVLGGVQRVGVGGTAAAAAAAAACVECILI